MVVALAAATIVAVPSVREPVLRAAGWALVVNEPVAPADIIVVSLDSGGAGALEAALPPWCDQHRFQSIVFVVARDHSRRLRRVLDRVMKGHPTRVTVRPERYSSFDPDRWWETRSGVRTEIVEFQKLVLEVVLHPISF